MLNQVVFVGRLVNDPEIKEIEDKKVCNVTIAVQRSYKNANGEYDTDFIPVLLWHGIADNVKEYCKKGDLVGIKGRLQMQEDKLIAVADKVTFLSSKRED